MVKLFTLLLLFGSLLVYVNKVTWVAALFSKRHLDTFEAILILCIYVAIVVPFIGNQHGCLLFQAWMLLEYPFGNTIFVLAMPLTRQHQVLNIDITLELVVKFVNLVSHGFILKNLRLEDFSELLIRLAAIIHRPLRNHRFKHIVVVVSTFKRLQGCINIVFLNRVLKS